MKMNAKTLVEVGADGVAVITINNPPLNLLSVDVMLSLKESIEGVVSRDDVKAIVIIGSNRKFSAGFDVTIFGGTQTKKTREELGLLSIQFVTDTLEAAKKPFVAAIDGPAFGGALEIALACHARISTSSAQLGLTELQYGIIPGLGGTQRLPRLVGLPKALEMILMSKRVDGEEARVLSLVDAIAPSDKLLEVARQWVLDILERTRPWVISLYKTEKLGTLDEARAILNSARIEVQRQNPNVVYPLECINVIEQGIVSDPRDALWKETEAFHELRQSSTCKSLVHFFFAQRLITKFQIPQTSEMNLLPRKINKVAVIGGGLVSSEIVALLVLRNYQVILKEKNEKHLLEEINKIKENLHTHFKNGKTTLQELEKAFTLLKGVLDYDSFGDVDLVIEAECETLSTKQDIFADLEKFCPPHCILTSSSSAFSLNLIGERTKCQDRIAGIHLFCLSPVMPLMEIVRMERTSPQTMVDVIGFARKNRKTPVVVSDCKGQGVNSMLVAYLHAAMLLAELGVDVYQIDQALKSFGMQFGPFRMIDMVGLKVFAEISKILTNRLPDRFHEPKLIPILQNADREGECNCKSFYKYDNSGNASLNPELRKYLIKARTVWSVDSEVTKLSDGEIVEMILFAAFNEACRVISDGIVIRSSDLDVASVLAMGFPSYRGGIHYWANNFDSDYVYSRLKKWSQAYGDFFEPCNYITERSAKSMPLVKSQL